jgi:hypothetical protein
MTGLQNQRDRFFDTFSASGGVGHSIHVDLSRAMPALAENLSKINCTADGVAFRQAAVA